MKALRMFVAALVVLVAAEALADDGQVPRSTLRALGLGGMQIVPESQGMQVRGKLAFVSVRGSSLIFGQLSDGTAFTSASNSDSASPPTSMSSTGSGTLSLSRSHSTPFTLSLSAGAFSGSISGLASGMGSVSVTVP